MAEAALHGVLRLVGPSLVKRAADASFKVRDQMSALREDGELHVFLAGTGSPLPDPTRANVCTVVMGGGNMLIFDVGPGSYAKCMEMCLPVSKCNAIFLTHYHSDHIGELGQFLTMSWAGTGGGRKHKLPVYGPPGVEEVVAGFALAYKEDSKYREDHHGTEHMPRSGSGGVAHTIARPGGNNDSTVRVKVYENNGLVVEAFNVDHKPVDPAFGYRITYKGRTVTLSGDTCQCASLTENSIKSDLFVCETVCCNILDNMKVSLINNNDKRTAKNLEDIKDYHCEIQHCVDTAVAAQVDTMVLSHMAPSPQDSWIFKQYMLAGLDMSGFRGKLIVGEDGMGFHLPPAPSRAINETHYINKRRGPPPALLLALLVALVAVLLVR